MRCHTCGQDGPTVMRVVIAKGYDRSLARPLFNCPSCFEQKERRTSSAVMSHAQQEESRTAR